MDAPQVRHSDLARLIAQSHLRFNPNHNEDGRFGAGSGGSESGGGSAGGGEGSVGRSFETHEEMSKWGDEHYGGKWEKKLSKDEVIAVKEYSQVTYGSTNEHLRSGRKLDPYVQGKVDATVKGLDSGLKKSSLPEDVVTFRGMNSAAFGKGNIVGSTFTDKGFVSTSLDKSVAQKFAKTLKNSKNGVLVEIRMPKGAKAAYINKLTATKGEHEILIARNARFKVISASKGHVVIQHIP